MFKLIFFLFKDCLKEDAWQRSAPNSLQKQEQVQGPLLAPSHFKTESHLKIIGKWGLLQTPSRLKTGQNNGSE